MIKIWLLVLVILASLQIYDAEAQPIPQESPKPMGSPATAPIDCYFSARELGLNYHKSIRLCTNTKSLDPILCFKDIFESLSNDQKVSLCQGATSKAPSECFEESFGLGLSFDQRTKLCSGAIFRNDVIPDNNAISTAPVHCFKQSVNLSLSQDQRIILCANADSDDPVQCFFSANLDLSMDQRVRLCTQLTPSSW